MTNSIHAFGATVSNLAPVLVAPAHDVTHDPVWLYSEDFESYAGTTTHNPGGWGTDLGQGQGDVYGQDYGSSLAHSGTCSMLVQSTGSSKPIEADHILTGLTVGRTYTISAWFQAAVSGLSAYTVLTSTPPTTVSAPVGQWVQVFFTFTASAATVTMTVGVAGVSVGAMGYWDDITVTQNAWVEHVPDQYATPDGTLGVTGGQITEDEKSGAQFVTASLTVSTPSDAVMAALDPTNSPRVLITAYYNDDEPEAEGTRTYDLMLIGNEDDEDSGETTLTLVSDDWLLQKKRLATSPVSLTNLQTSVRAITQNVVTALGGKTLASGPDADFTTYAAAQNLATNPKATTIANWATTGSTGSSSTFAVSTNASATPPFQSYVRLLFGTGAATTAGISYGETVSFTAGQTYTFSIFGQVGKAGTAGATNLMSARLIWLNANGSEIGTRSYAATRATGANWSQRFIVTGTAPSGAAAYQFAFYGGTGAKAWASGDIIYATGVQILEGNGLDTDGSTPIPYFDGDTANPSSYTFAWDDAANASTSTRTPVVDRDPDSLTWDPGVSGWDFLSSIHAAVGMRLWVDDARVWHLTNNDYVPAGLWTADFLENIYEGTKTLDLTGTEQDGTPLVVKSAVVHYSWTDRNGNSREAWDSYPASGSQLTTALIEIDKPYPGAGAARYWVTRNQNRGLSLSIVARLDYSVQVGQQVSVQLPDTDAIQAYVAAVTWDASADTMTVVTRGVITYPQTSWALQPATETWASLPVTTTWANFA